MMKNSSSSYLMIVSCFFFLVVVAVNSQRTLISLRSKLKRLKVSSDTNDPAAAADLGRFDNMFLDWLLSIRESFPFLKEDDLNWIIFLSIGIVIIIVLLLLAIVTIVNILFKYTEEKKKKNESSSSSSSSAYLHNNNNNDVLDGEKKKSDSTTTSEAAELSFEGIRVVLQKKDKERRILLDGSIRGTARPGKLLAIMGPSGSGKSTLLEALAGQIPYSKKLSVYGNRYINGDAIMEKGGLPQTALIPQESNFFPHMTVQETLEFRADLILAGKKRSEKQKVLQSVMQQLNLSHLADTSVGDGGKKVRGLSGGERKRLSIAIKMIGDPPSILFLDEPTSGLDSYQAKQVVASLRRLADETSKTIVAVIHQPSQQAFAQFDDVLVLTEGGRQIYFGPTQDIRNYLQKESSSSSLVVEKETGTAEYILECVSKINANGGPEEIESLKRIDALATKAKAQKIALSKSSDVSGVSQKNNKKKSSRRRKANWFHQFYLLFKRTVRETFRGKTTIVIKVVQQVMLGVIYGGIYKLGTNQSSIQDRIGLLSLIAIGSMNMGMAGTIRSFPKEKSIVARETSSNLYNTGPYFLAKAIGETPVLGILSGIFSVIVYAMTGLQRSKFPVFCGLISLHTIASEAAGLFIGSVSASSDIALALFPAIAVLNIIFDGKNISEENIPTFLKWLPKVGLVRWGFEGLTINEFQGLTFDKPQQRRGPMSFQTGEEVLDRYGMAGTSVLDVVKVQGAMILSLWLLSYLGLTFGQQKYMSMRQPPKQQSKEKEE